MSRLLLPLLLSLSMPSGAWAQSSQASKAGTPSEPAAPAEYTDAIEQAVSEFSQARWPEARALFRKAHRIQPSARTLRGLGMVAYELREYAPALEYLSAAVKDPRRPLTPDQRAKAKALMDRSKEFVGRITVKVTPAHATLLVNRVQTPIPDRPLTLSIGKHLVSVSAAGHEDWEQRVVVKGGEDETLKVRLKKRSARTPAKVAAPATAAATHLPRRHDPKVLAEAVKVEALSQRIQERIQRAIVAVGQDPERSECLMMAVHIIVSENSHMEGTSLTGDSAQDLAFLTSLKEKLQAVDESVTRCLP